MNKTPEHRASITAEADGMDAIKFTFPDGRTFIREDVRHVLGWVAVTDQAESSAYVQLHCRDEYARWATMIVADKQGGYEEKILIPRSAHGEKTSLSDALERLLANVPTVTVPPFPSCRAADVVHSELV